MHITAVCPPNQYMHIHNYLLTIIGILIQIARNVGNQIGLQHAT